MAFGADMYIFSESGIFVKKEKKSVNYSMDYQGYMHIINDNEQWLIQNGVGFRSTGLNVSLNAEHQAHVKKKIMVLPYLYLLYFKFFSYEYFLFSTIFLIVQRSHDCTTLFQLFFSIGGRMLTGR